ncbi:unnamed protein product [Pleuronectes platessa]|uniref:Uncharacterized protein n=1 Tax=Pleuronectes platessa TaxID=8262 RepID=A0A9N7ULF5_PLEPL|nr:unnamed protein product [Pleuronectes platessa]
MTMASSNVSFPSVNLINGSSSAVSVAQLSNVPLLCYTGSSSRAEGNHSPLPLCRMLDVNPPPLELLPWCFSSLIQSRWVLTADLPPYGNSSVNRHPPGGLLRDSQSVRTTIKTVALDLATSQDTTRLRSVSLPRQVLTFDSAGEALRIPRGSLSEHEGERTRAFKLSQQDSPRW